MSKRSRKCILCGKTLDIGEYGNSPEPLRSLNDGVCCDACNMNKVLPARLAQLRKAELREQLEQERMSRRKV